VALAALATLQTIALALIARRGVILPPTNRRTRSRPRDEDRQE
jgi:hypothetical protein